MLLTTIVRSKKIISGSCLALCLIQLTGISAAADIPQPVSKPAEIIAAEQSRLHIDALFPDGQKPLYSSTLARLYASHNMSMLWQDKNATVQFQQQLAVLSVSGVQPQFGRWAEQLADPALEGMNRDIVLSDAMLGYLQFVSGVTSHGESWLYSHQPYKMALPSTSLISKWQSAIIYDELTAFVQSLAPAHPYYQPMQHTLLELLADKRPWPQLEIKRTLRPGEVSQEVPSLNDMLWRNGMLTDHAYGSSSALATANRHLAVTAQAQMATEREGQLPDDAFPAMPSDSGGLYSPTLVAGVKRFQQQQGLKPDGVIGRQTRAWLNVSPQQRASLLALNMQRLRLLQEAPHNGIMVNIPDYSLSYYADGHKMLTSRVIVGRPDRKTPLMHSTLINLVLNPPWNVPVSMVRRDIIPKVKNDPGYLNKHGYTLLSGWGDDAEVIDPLMIDWSRVTAASFPYHIRQAPGSANALGNYKFNMPNSEAIYLHDTPNHQLFSKENLALSSGCVRVSKAVDLASLLLKGAGWKDKSISDSLEQGNTRYVAIGKHIRVNLYYLTAWVADDGIAQFRTDIYNYDSMASPADNVTEAASQLLSE